MKSNKIRYYWFRIKKNKYETLKAIAENVSLPFSVLIRDIVVKFSEKDKELTGLLKTKEQTQTIAFALSREEHSIIKNKIKKSNCTLSFYCQSAIENYFKEKIN
jgi:predicted DNA-binding protein